MVGPSRANWPKPDVALHRPTVFVVPGDRVAPVFRGVGIEEDPREEAPSGFNSRRGRALPLVRDREHVKASLADRAFVGRRQILVAVRAVMRQDYPGRAQSSANRTARPVD
jgi:hypothetical protein